MAEDEPLTELAFRAAQTIDRLQRLNGLHELSNAALLNRVRSLEQLAKGRMQRINNLERRNKELRAKLKKLQENS